MMGRKVVCSSCFSIYSISISIWFLQEQVRVVRFDVRFSLLGTRGRSFPACMGFGDNLDCLEDLGGMEEPPSLLDWIRQP